jgi:hypothetical protein
MYCINASLLVLTEYCEMHTVHTHFPHRWYLHFVVVVGLACLQDPESYAGGSIATGRVSHAGQVKGDRPD